MDRCSEIVRIVARTPSQMAQIWRECRCRSRVYSQCGKSWSVRIKRAQAFHLQVSTLPKGARSCFQCNRVSLLFYEALWLFWVAGLDLSFGSRGMFIQSILILVSSPSNGAKLLHKLSAVFGALTFSLTRLRIFSTNVVRGIAHLTNSICIKVGRFAKKLNVCTLPTFRSPVGNIRSNGLSVSLEDQHGGSKGRQAGSPACSFHGCLRVPRGHSTFRKICLHSKLVAVLSEFTELTTCSRMENIKDWPGYLRKYNKASPERRRSSWSICGRLRPKY